MSVSIVICCHNSAHLLPRTLRYVEAQQASCPWEVVLIDNASTDNTAKVAVEVWPTGRNPRRVIGESR